MIQSDIPLFQPFNQRIMSLAARIVPANERAEWLRVWHAELWHMHDRDLNRHVKKTGRVAGLSAGIVRDALWLRTENWRCSLRGSASLCLATLLGLSLLSFGFALFFEGSWSLLSPPLLHQLKRSLVTVPFLIFVSFATGSQRHVEQSSLNGPLIKLKRYSFFAVKMTQVLLLAFLSSTDSYELVHGPLPGLAALLQLLWFVSFAMLGLRWTLADQEQRCKHCLQSLQNPARVGRPSHNLLEWNGTELNCKWGHGLLSIPEIETSWCRSSKWIVSRRRT